MMKDWKNIVFRNWSLIRLVRLGSALFILIEAIKNYDTMFGVIGTFLLLQSVFNVGSCSNGVCYTVRIEDAGNKSEDIIYEETKNK